MKRRQRLLPQRRHLQQSHWYALEAFPVLRRSEQAVVTSLNNSSHAGGEGGEEPPLQGRGQLR